MSDPRTLVIDRLGDTIHAGSLFQAMALAGRTEPTVTHHAIKRNYVDLFKGAAFTVSPSEYTLVHSVKGRVFGRGPIHGQHIRDKLAHMLDVCDLNGRVYLPITKTIARERIVLLCPYGHPGLTFKEWPIANWQKVAEEARGLGYLILTNGNRMQKQPIAGMGRLTNVPIRELAQLMTTAAAVVGIDSGHIHLADALSNPPVGLYASTSTVTYGPYINKQFCVDHHRDASPSFKPYDSTTLLSQRAMQSISVDEVIAQLRARLQIN